MIENFQLSPEKNNINQLVYRLWGQYLVFNSFSEFVT